MILILQGSKTDGERFLKQNLYQEALACYNVALDTAMSLRIHEDEVAKIFSNRSLVFAKLGLPLDALSDAEQCIGLSPKWWKVGYCVVFKFICIIYGTIIVKFKILQSWKYFAVIHLIWFELWLVQLL